jgi:hypothetical protein
MQGLVWGVKIEVQAVGWRVRGFKGAGFGDLGFGDLGLRG